jgi:hypothetical protein
VRLGHKTQRPPDIASRLLWNDEALAAPRSITTAAECVNGVEVILDYRGDPVLLPGVTKRVTVSCDPPDSSGTAEADIRVPDGWSVTTIDARTFDLAADSVADRNALTVTVSHNGEKLSADFAMLGPGEAKGVPSAKNVERCRQCGARKAACSCPQTS